MQFYRMYMKIYLEFLSKTNYLYFYIIFNAILYDVTCKTWDKLSVNIDHVFCTFNYNVYAGNRDNRFFL